MRLRQTAAAAGLALMVAACGSAGAEPQKARAVAALKSCGAQTDMLAGQYAVGDRAGALEAARAAVGACTGLVEASQSGPCVDFGLAGEDMATRAELALTRHQPRDQLSYFDAAREAADTQTRCEDELTA